MSHILFAVNPLSSGPPVGDFAALARRQLVGHRVTFFVPQAMDEFAQLAEQSRLQQPDMIVVVGGDGSTNLFLEALIQSRRPTYLFPAGTANDLARELGHRSDFDDLRRALTTERHTIDIIEVNGRPFATVGGLGVGSVLTADMNAWRNQHSGFRLLTRFFGKHSYALIGIDVIGRGRYPILDAQLTIEGVTESFQTGCILVANQARLGGNLLVTPEAENHDGILDIMILKDASREGLLRSLFLMRSGQVPEDAELRRATAATLRLNGNHDAAFFADGETLCADHIFELSVRPNALIIAGPFKMEERKQ